MSDQSSKFISRFPIYISGLTIAFGVMVLTGWIFHIQRLKGLIPGQVAVKANAAICYVLIGAALWLATSGISKRVGSVPSKALGLMAATIGLLSFLEFWKGWDLGIDQLIFKAGPDDLPGSIRLALMAPIAATDFFLLGITFSVLDRKADWARLLQHLLPAIAALVAMFGILDFVLDSRNTHTHIAPMTAFILFLCSLGVLCVRAESGLGALLVSTTVGGVLCRRLLPSSILIPIAIAWLRWRGQQAGLYSEWSGLAIMTISAGGLLAALTVWTAVVLDRIEAKRERAEGSVRRLAAIVISSSDAIVGKTLDGIVTSWNPGAEGVYGYTAEEMIGQNVACLIPPDRLEEFQAFLQRLRKGETIAPCETERIRKDGKRISVSITLSPLRDDASNIVGASTIARDISDRKKAAEDLRHAARYARSLIEASLDPLVTINRDGKITDVNEATEKATGVSRAQLIGSDFSDYFTDPQRAREGYQRVFANGFVRDYPLAIRSTSGAVMDVLYHATVFKRASGEVEGVFAAARDITERKRAEAALQESERNFRTLANTVPQLVWMCTPDGLNVYFNQRWVEYTGLTLEESYGRNWSTPFHPDDKQAASNAWNHAVRSGEIYSIDCRLRAADGSYRWFLIRGVPLHDGKGDIVKWFGTCTDVDDAKQAEAQIARQNALLNAVNSVFREALSSEDESRLWRKCLGMAETLTGSKFGFIDQLNADDRLDSLALSNPGWEQCKMPAEQASLLLKNIEVRGIYASVVRQRQSVLTNDPARSPGWFGLPKGHPPLTSFLGVPLSQGDRTIGIIGVGNKPNGYDAADQGNLETLAVSVVEALMRKRAEAQVRRLNEELERRVMERTAQLESANKELEAFTYSVSHDLRAPLRHVSGFSKILSEEFSESLPPEAQRHVQRIQEGTRRMGQLIDDLLNLARVGRKELSLQVGGLRSIVAEVIEGLSPDVGARQVEWKIGDLPYVECDTALMHQVFQNLLSNALKFTRPRSHAVIEVGQEQRDGQPMVYVRDNGVGFSMKYADKLFGVFQRLHRAEDFEGTGVGLATVQRIVQKHGGRIWAEAELDKGASFYFTLGNSQSSDNKAKSMVAGENS